MSAELRHWRAFAAAAQARDFTQAASQLGLSQPALSQLIQSLEASLHTSLFDRTGRRARLTEAGTKLLTDARLLIEQADRLGGLARANGRSGAQTLAAGYVGSAAFHPAFAALIAAISADQPAISLHLDQFSATSQIEQLTNYTLDLGIARSPLPDLGARLTSLTLARERMIIALADTNPLAKAPRCSLAKLREAPFIQYLQQPSGGLREWVNAACAKAGFEPKIAHTVPQIATMLCLVGAGVGVALVPETMARFGVPGVTYRPMTQHFTTELTLLYRRSDTAPALRQTLRLARPLINKPSL
ncbi:MAG TPA: LysR family transcriptional regulator [Acidiphilium sp.]|nr:MAG: hypothetical protein B7Z67_00425 [Acidiphilium sp. 21-60-14]OYV92207.1 MAG: hypothetical protein B7Z57_01370 [Acidiphilium sp. 37-60-79]OZB40610.1 MAG: hypothetical protein B7X48_04440 [Acidiphilium sp. 34-60-192]HQT87428.1 LysR family transcriptional regulator [Acidiphilium sp.]HQU23134.1 LysR family transcriptional regulator [Acidiphilium sp.]